MPKKNSFASIRRKRRENRIFFVSTEGSVTEPGYFRHLETLLNKDSIDNSIVLVHANTKSEPNQVLKRMKDYLANHDLLESDEAWLVVDRNGRPKDRFSALFEWEQSNCKHNVALSNPCFEFWLLLHFENCRRNQDGSYYKRLLRRHDPNYVKQINKRLYDLEGVKNALVRAQNDSGAKNSNCMEDLGCTTVCKLIENCLKGRHANSN